MLSFEKILQVFEDILRQDPLYEVVSTSHGYTLLAWDSHRNQWYSAELLETPEVMLDTLLDVYASYLESKLTEDERDDLTAQEEEEIENRCEQIREKCLAHRLDKKQRQ